MAPSTQDSIRITKSFTYRGSTKTWSNRYYLRDPVPVGDRSAAVDAVADREQPLFAAAVEIVQGEYIVAGSDVPYLTNAYSLAGSFAVGASGPTPGDCAIVVRYSTDLRTSKNHPIYLFNYYHGARYQDATHHDNVDPAQLALFQAYADDWTTGIVYGGGAGDVVRAGPRGVVAQTAYVDPYIGHRDFT